MVFDDEKNATALPRRGTLKNAASLPPVTVSAFRENPFDLTFTNKLRNVIEYTFECLRDSVADQKPMASYLERSIAEMKTLASQADRRLSLQTLRRLNELIEEVEAFARGEKTALTNTDDYQGVLHYRHYVRIAWLTHFILGDLSASGL
jgi:hypothetical protein